MSKGIDRLPKAWINQCLQEGSKATFLAGVVARYSSWEVTSCAETLAEMASNPRRDRLKILVFII